MNGTINKALETITNPFTIVDMGIEEYSNYCRKISRILDSMGQAHTGWYDMINRRGRAIVRVSCLIDTLADIALRKTPYVLDYWNVINEIKPDLLLLLNRNLYDDDVQDSIVKIEKLYED